MYKIVIKHVIFFLCGITSLLLLLQFQSLAAYADNGAQVTLSMPNNAPLVGHVGTRVLIAGSNFPANAVVSLFTTPSSSLSKCKVSSLQNPSNYGLMPFASAPTQNTDGQGSFQLDTTWPANANIATTNYYICAIVSASNNGSGNGSGKGSSQGAALTTSSFTVAQPAQASVSTQTVSAGGSVTITGTGWLPPQALVVSIQSNNGVLISTNVPAGSIDSMTGNFSVNLTIPGGADPRDYDVKVYAPGEPALTKTLPAAITVNTTTSTPTVAPTVQTTVQATPTTVAATSSGSGSSGGGGSNLLVFFLGGLGAILVIVGITVFVVYSRARPV